MLAMGARSDLAWSVMRQGSTDNMYVHCRVMILDACPRRIWRALLLLYYCWILWVIFAEFRWSSENGTLAASTICSLQAMQMIERSS